MGWIKLFFLIIRYLIWFYNDIVKFFYLKVFIFLKLYVNRKNFGMKLYFRFWRKKNYVFDV